MPSLSSELLVSALLAALVAAVVTGALVPFVIRIARTLHAVDHPGGRRHQERAVPRLGGLAIVSGLGIALVFVTLILRSAGEFPLSRNELLAMALATFMVFLVGLVDDVSGVSALDKFLVEVLAAFLVVRVGWAFDVLGLPGGTNLDLGLLGQAVSVLWIVGVTNAINLLDGLDGLAGGVVAIIAGSFLAYGVFQGNDLTAVAMAAVVGACVGFLRYNWAPARIYLGDSGSLTLGFLLAITSVHSSLKAPAAIAILVPILVLGLPVIDTLLVMGLRFLDRPKGPFGARFQRMFHADRNHLHHLLLRLGGSRQTVVVWIYAAAAAFCLFALVVAFTRSAAMAAALMITEFVAIAMMRGLGLRGGVRQLAESRSLESASDRGHEPLRRGA
jgi:UDP-GlcNAc:undecaprenyl-phosphate/decaprenyl-phosphate GlcNAc-1-phosphate transferase